MKEQEIKKILSKLYKCCEIFQIWNKKSNSILDIQKQFNSVNRVKWGTFNLPEVVRDDTIRSLEIRFIEECHLLSNEVSNLTELSDSLMIHEKTYHSFCLMHLTDRNSSASFEHFDTLAEINICVKTIIGMIEFLLRNLSIRDEQSFEYFKEAIKSMQKVEEKIEIWKVLM